MTSTLSTLIDRHGVDVLDHLDREVTVPILAGLQAQGDLLFLPAAMVKDVEPATVPLPAAGVPLVRGENGGNTHTLIGDGPIMWAPAVEHSGSQVLGTITVPDGSTAYSAHPEHGYAGFAPGTYQVRRQREQAEQIRLVQD